MIDGRDASSRCPCRLTVTLGRGTVKVRCQNSSSLAHGGLERGRAAQGWMGPGGWTAGWTACAVGNYGFCAHAGMLLLTHGTRLHPTRVPACLPGTRTVTDHSLHGVRHRRQRGAAAAVLVLRVGRAEDCCCCGLLPRPHTTRTHTWSTLVRPLGLSVQACSAMCLERKTHPCR